ncbi:MAG: hypothetical protein KAJ33_06885, partial [Thermoplasmata archaeon]|nr:hypothetical protein [Thermoplasmata archaeon]
EETTAVIIDIPEDLEGTTTTSSAGDVIIYSNTDEFVIEGFVEADQTLSLVGIEGDIIIKPDNSFSIILSPNPGENTFFIKVTDSNGNVAEIWRTLILDQVAPEFDSVRFSDGFLTNEQATTITGEMTERGYMTINDEIVNVNSDGTFSHMTGLKEGVNTLYFQFKDLAGNSVDQWHNITLDTVAPLITLDSDDTTVYDSSFELVGTVEAGAEVLINGKRTQVGTRQSGEFTSTVILSPGINTIIIEAEDAAGNIAEYRHNVIFDTNGETSINWGAIGLIMALLVVGLVLGLFFGGMLGGTPREEIDEMPPEDIDSTDMEEIPMDEEMPMEDSLPEEDGLEEIPEEEIVEPIEGLEPIPDEEGMPEDLPEEVDAEPIPEEEALPEETPEEVEPSEPEEVPEEPEEIQETEVAPEEVMEEPAVEEDPRIGKLKAAYESGKISQELYEKNLAKFQEK